MKGLWHIRPGVTVEVEVIGHEKPWGVHRLLVRSVGGGVRVTSRWVNADRVDVERVTGDGLGYVPWDAHEQGYR